MAQALAAGAQIQQIQTRQAEAPDTLNDHAPAFVAAPAFATSSTTPGCTPATALLRFDGGYEVSMCYRTPDTADGTEGVEGQAKAGLYASAESGLLWFFSRENAEVLVKVLTAVPSTVIAGSSWRP